MNISLEAVGLLISALLGVGSFIGAIYFISSKFTHLEGRVTSMEAEMQKDELNRKQLDQKLDSKLLSLDERIQAVDSIVVGLGVKVDGVKEGVDDLKKIVTEYLFSKPAR